MQMKKGTAENTTKNDHVSSDNEALKGGIHDVGILGNRGDVIATTI